MLIEREHVNIKKAHWEDFWPHHIWWGRFISGGSYMEFVFLNRTFLKDYASCSEIEKKEFCPYIMVLATIDNIDFAIPLRSNINHNHAVWTDKANKCGLDLSKTVIINDKNKYIDYSNKPHIRQNEFDALRGKEHYVKQKLETYINKYKKALSKRNLPDNDMLCKYSTLQYFHKELGINDIEKGQIAQSLNEAAATIEKE